VRYKDVSPAMRAFIGTRELFRRMGFAAGELFCESASSARNNLILSGFLVLKTQGKEFAVELGPIDSVEAFREEYYRVRVALNKGKLKDRDLKRMLHECEAYRDKAGCLLALVTKGIVPPVPPIKVPTAGVN